MFEIAGLTGTRDVRAPLLPPAAAVVDPCGGEKADPKENGRKQITHI